MRKLLLVLAFASVAFAGIAQSQNEATIIVARKGLYSGVKKYINIYVDGSNVAELADGRYVAIKVPAGSHKVVGQWYAGKLKEKDERDAVSIELEAGKEYYLRALREERGLVTVVSLEEITASSFAKLKTDLKQSSD